jgi:hypothetical protein
MVDNQKRFIVRYSKMMFVMRHADSEKDAVIDTVWNLDMEDRRKVLLQCYEYKPDTDSGLPDWEGPLFSHDHTFYRPFKPNWVVRGLDAEEVQES